MEFQEKLMSLFHEYKLEHIDLKGVDPKLCISLGAYRSQRGGSQGMSTQDTISMKCHDYSNAKFLNARLV